MKSLIVGAGAVGLVYGYHLAEAGAEVSFFVKEKYAAEAREGFHLHQYKLGCSDTQARFSGFGVFTEVEALEAHTFDQVWLCVSATALRAGDWLDAILAASGDAAIVLMTPGIADRRFLLEKVSEDRLISGMIGFISYQAPLPGEQREPGLAYILPPISPSLFSGPEAATRALVDALKKGGCGARKVDSAPQQAAMGSAVMMPHIAALELAGWSMSELTGGELLEQAGAAAQEFLAISSAYHDIPIPAAMKMLKPWFMKAGLGLAPALLPFDLEVYLRYHFTKVGDQTRAMFENSIALAKAKGIEVPAMEGLLEGMRALDEAA